MRFCAFLFGVLFITLGILGFRVSNQELLFGVFKVNFGLNALHLIVGIVGFIICFMKLRAISFYFQMLGIAMGLLGVMGFVYDETNILGIFASNPPMTWLHIIAATNALILGYGGQGERNQRHY